MGEEKQGNIGKFELDKVYLGDSRSLSKEIPSESVKMVLTSVPYLDRVDYNGEGLGKIKSGTYVDWIRPLIYEIKRVLREDGVFVLNFADVVKDGFIDPYTRHTINLIVDEVGLLHLDKNYWFKKSTQNMRPLTRNVVEDIHIFAKSEKYEYNLEEVTVDYAEHTVKRFQNPFYRKGEKVWRIFKDRGALPTNVFEFPSEKSKSKQHPATFPITLPTHFIKAFTNKNDTVFDPFMGSGTTGEASKGMERHFLGFDAKPEFVEIANKNVERTVRGSLLKEHEEERNEFKNRLERKKREILDIQVSKGRSDVS